MRTFKIDDVRDMLPELDELRPLLDSVIVHSTPDRSRTWSGSGRLETVGSRVVDTRRLAEESERLADAEAAHTRAVFDAVTRALQAAAEGDAAASARALLEAAALEEARDRPERAEAYAGAAVRALTPEQDRKTAALAGRRWARAARARGRLDVALGRYESAYEAAGAQGDPRGAAEAAVGAGNVLEDQGRWEEAKRWYESALEAVAELDGSVPERLHAFLNLHIVTRSLGALDASVDWLTRAEEAADLVDPVGAAPFLDNARGQLCMAAGDFAGAEEHLVRGLSGAVDARARVTIRLNLAEAHLARGRTLDAAEQAREAEREALAGALVPKLPEVYRLLGRIASRDDDPDAFVLFERALEIIRERGLPPLEEAITLQAYAEAEERGGDAEAADALRSAARERFSEIGITHLRQPWADVYGPESPSAALPTDE